MTIRPAVITVLEIRRQHVRLVAIDNAGIVRSSRLAPHVVVHDAPYPHCHVDHISRWLFAALADFGERFRIEAIVPTTYGAAAALVGPDGLVLPVMDQAAEPPASLVRGYAEIAPWFDECLCSPQPAAQTLACQLFWLCRSFASAFARTTWILPFPQYWAWRLSGQPASEITALGAQTQLWDPRRAQFSSLAREQGWDRLFPPRHDAWSQLGGLQPDIASEVGLPSGTPVICGIQDVHANYARSKAAKFNGASVIYADGDLISTNQSLNLLELDPIADMAAQVDLEGRPVASIRFPVQRVYAAVAGRGGDDTDPGAEAVGRLIDAGTFVRLPEAACSLSQHRGGDMSIEGPRPATDEALAALAALQVALMADLALDRLQVQGRIAIDGDLAGGALTQGLLAGLRPEDRVEVSPGSDTTALGAALLARWGESMGSATFDLEPVEPLRLTGLRSYRDHWRQRAGIRIGAPSTAEGEQQKRHREAR